ncbi:unnamed protein product, partial [Symbiodinium sp. KB8]
KAQQEEGAAGTTSSTSIFAGDALSKALESHALDMSDAEEEEDQAFWGGVTIIVPPGVAVEQNGQAIMGSFAGNGGVYSSATETVQSRATNASITIKVEGTAMWGSVT